MKKLHASVLAVLATILVLLFFTIYSVPVLFQEGNPLPVARSIVTLELTESDIVSVNERVLLQKAGPELPLTSYLENHGWEFKDRLGAGIFYEKDSALMFAEARMFTRFYVIYELDREI